MSITDKIHISSSVANNDDTEKSWKEKTKKIKAKQRFYITKYWWLVFPIYILILLICYFAEYEKLNSLLPIIIDFGKVFFGALLGYIIHIILDND